ncbi:MAG: glycosyltransferase family 8 protein [Flavobacteriaceae bacterium]|nr:glycosyltransferase family 8 protein [Flavobacteriaceae bacterium]
MSFFPIVLTCDDKYFKYASVVITSIIKNRNKNYQYEINVVSDYISSENQEKTIRQAKNIKNFSIKFIELKNIDKSRFFLNSYMSASTYYRFYIPELFKDYERILYLDCDLIVDQDISELATMDFYENGEEKLALVCKDPYIMYKLSDEGKDEDLNINYFKNILGMPNPYEYFNAGVMVYNLRKINELHLSEKLFDALDKIKKPILQDQDILNAVFSKNGGGKFISNTYNDVGRKHLSKIRFIKKKIKQFIGLKDKTPYHIYHYVGGNKPWKFKRLNYRLFYFYAMSSPFYREILKENNTKFWF